VDYDDFLELKNGFDALTQKVEWLMEHHSRLLVGHRVNVGQIRLPDYRYGKGGPGTITACRGGQVDVLLDSGTTIKLEIHDFALQPTTAGESNL
jgi:hypothetical protein